MRKRAQASRTRRRDTWTRSSSRRFCGACGNRDQPATQHRSVRRENGGRTCRAAARKACSSTSRKPLPCSTTLCGKVRLRCEALTYSAGRDMRRNARNGGAAVPRPARRPEQPQSKRARTRAIVLDDDEEEDEDEEPVVAVDVAAPVAEPAPADADESAWVRALAAVLPQPAQLCVLAPPPVRQLLPPPASARTAVMLSEEEQKLLRHAARGCCLQPAVLTPLRCSAGAPNKRWRSCNGQCTRSLRSLRRRCSRLPHLRRRL